LERLKFADDIEDEHPINNGGNNLKRENQEEAKIGINYPTPGGAVIVSNRSSAVKKESHQRGGSYPETYTNSQYESNMQSGTESDDEFDENELLSGR